MALLQPPAATWMQIEQRGIERYKANKEDMDFVRMALAGVHIPTIAEGTRLHKKYGNTNPFANAMVDVIEEAGGSSAEARALLSFHAIVAAHARQSHFWRRRARGVERAG